MTVVPRREAALTVHTRSTVVAVTPAGPVLSGRRAPTRRTRAETFVNVLDTRQRVVIGILTAGWLITFAFFWAWWLRPEHLVGWVGMVVNSMLLFYLAYLPLYFTATMNRLREVDPTLEVPDLSVAFVVTKAPSEPWSTAQRTLTAMLDQEYPHPFDVWLCDEDPSAETTGWCAANGVSLLSRRGIADYHEADWPRRTKCKEGNLAYFYDTVGYRTYDVVSQLDCDHIPTRSYLTEIVRPFRDPAIGYVAAPSVCDSNSATSWSARGRLYKEASFHGPFQSGHSDGLAPVSIGSHYAVRTEALRDIGGIGPELAEDFSTSFLLTSAGWHGAFAHRAEAHGDGPLTVTAMVTQEFQWSRSLMMLLTTTAPKHLPRLSWMLRVRFLFALSFYPLLVITTVVGLALPPIAVITGSPWVNVSYFEFLLRWMLVGAWMLALTYTIRRWDLLRPHRAPIVSWENWLYTFARWPFITAGVLAGLAQSLRTGSVVTFRVTPKVRNGMEPLSLRIVMPFAALSILLGCAALIGEGEQGDRQGYVFLCLLGAFCYSIVAITLPLLHALESARSAGTRFAVAVHRTARTPLAVGVTACAAFCVAVAPFPAYVAPAMAHIQLPF
ncbi:MULTISPECIES: glycosyltransferase family 2 protein [unclassified Cryobacterium]|uniref:glycosyltransferase family 2 protein n=1 Tax=unclassified Cryobacterium TaxID=2649013 RepID=UPI002AB38337|nr:MULTISPECIES: glycosyltransferase family 2 protein [unclassified Cryobacterium]MDY7541190.1 glycosyltransferase [Cryobacterium sp. 5B3]MEB0000050.1 glycosyltransferase [Cryobacterium sp. RTS3]MEB0267631.1 glycosyltransferase [Cryobacterium sp. 10I5]MEB0275614.1 glycosyltransferase [Cryobacterium sp. 5B3]